MDAPLEPPADEVARLRRCLNDLVSIMALPALWARAEPQQIIRTLLDALGEMLGLAFVFVRLPDPTGGPAVERVRVRAPSDVAAPARAIGAMLDRSLGTTPSRWPASARLSMGEAQLCVATVPLGLRGELGFVVAGSERPDFPRQTERLLLDVAANQAAIGLQQARLLYEQRLVARELDERVAQRTGELAASNEELRREVAERRRAEDALRRSERDSRAIVDNIPGLVALLTATGDIDVVNRQLLDYFGQTVDQLRTWATTDTVHPEDRPHVIDVFSRSIASGTPYTIVHRFRRSDGTYRWFENSGFPVREADGRIARWCVLLTDTDERKRAEDALKHSERDLKLTVDTIPALAWSARPDGSVEFFNQHYLDFVGVAAERATSWGWTSAVHPDDLRRLLTTWRRMMQSEQPEEAEARLRRHDGEYRWFLFRANPLRDETGRIVKWYGVNTDIEKRKQAEAELRRAYDSFADAQHLSRTGSFVADLVADEHTWSDETYRIFEFDPGGKVTVQRIRDVIHPDDRGAFDDMVVRGRSGADVSFAFRILPALETVKHVRGVAHVVERMQGRPILVGALQDVTETVVAEEALNRARAELAHVARVTAVSTLTASIAHEVNQPLSGIITNASTCVRMLDADPPDVDGARETARRTIRDGHRASDIITRLRTLFSRREFTLESLDLNEATREVLALSSGELQRDRVIVQSELAEHLPPVTGDRVQLQQVILNLLRNAADAMRGVDDRPRHLLIRTERAEAGGARVTVRDAGVGIDPDGLGKLFDAFYTTKHDGMGIGLSISRSIVERHQGRIWAEANDGPGATFAFSIPLRPDAGDERATEKGSRTA